MENSRFKLVFLDCYFLMSNKEYRTDVKHRPKGSNLFTEATQLSLLWQRWRSKMADILVSKLYNSKTKTATPKFYLIKWFLLVYLTSLTILKKFCWSKNNYYELSHLRTMLYISTILFVAHQEITVQKYQSKSWIFHFMKNCIEPP